MVFVLFQLLSLPPKDLMKLDVTKRKGGPNFHKLQIYSNIWQDLNEDTPTFGKILSEIKVNNLSALKTYQCCLVSSMQQLITF